MNWNKLADHDGKEYVLLLLEDAHGVRRLELLDAALAGNAMAVNAECVFVSRPIPVALLKGRNLLAIAESVPLSNGQSFYLDAHCIWFTQEEIDDLDADKKTIRWARGRPPMLPPR